MEENNFNNENEGSLFTIDKTIQMGVPEDSNVEVKVEPIKEEEYKPAPPKKNTGKIVAGIIISLIVIGIGIFVAWYLLNGNK